MSFRCSRTWGRLGLALLGGAGLCASPTRGEVPASAPLAEAPPQPGVTSTPVVGPRRDGLQRLEERLGDFFKSFAPKKGVESSLEPQFVQPPRPLVVVPDQRTKDLIEEQRNWMLKDPNEQARMPSDEEIFKVPRFGDGDLEKNKLTPYEAFFQSLSPERPGTKAGDLSKDDARSEAHKRTALTKSGEEEQVPGSLQTTERRLREVLENSAKGGDLADLLRDAAEAARLESRPEESPYLREYRQMLQGSRSGASGLNLPGGLTADPAFRAPGDFRAVDAAGAAPHRDLFDPTSGAMPPGYTPDALADVNSRVLNQWNPLYRAPQVTPQRATAPKPNFEAPRRKF